jgi:hypothetical protein
MMWFNKCPQILIKKSRVIFNVYGTIRHFNLAINVEAPTDIFSNFHSRFIRQSFATVQNHLLATIHKFRLLSTELDESLLMSSTMKKRRAKMNKHKLKKRRKKLRANTKVSRQ